jgi:hypothetical protein
MVFQALEVRYTIDGHALARAIESAGASKAAISRSMKLSSASFLSHLCAKKKAQLGQKTAVALAQSLTAHGVPFKVRNFDGFPIAD